MTSSRRDDETTEVAFEIGFVRVEIYEFHDAEDGKTYLWNATEGRRIAEAKGEWPVSVDLVVAGMTPVTVLRYCPELNVAKALSLPSEALLCPLLFVEHHGKHVLCDGWHRVYRAVFSGVGELPAYILTQEEADAILIRVEPGSSGEKGNAGAKGAW